MSEKKEIAVQDQGTFEIRRSTIKNTTTNINLILTALKSGATANNELMMEMVDAMFKFIREVCESVDKKEEV